MHTSTPLELPIEFIQLTSISPLISKCQIKVCYVSDEPNRNRSVITKDVAREMANSLPGSPIVGYYNENKEDFEEHNRLIKLTNGKFEIEDTTKPYGFVDLTAKAWFQKFLDDDEVEREYLVTEGYLWTGQYPECKRIISKGNNQSMELDENTLDAAWTKDDNGKPKFFIINEAIISKLCILGEDCEPCFEGSSIKAPTEFSFNDNFKEKLFSMIEEWKQLLNEGGEAKVFTQYMVSIGDELWSAIYSHLEKAYPGDSYCSMYRIEGIFEEGEQKFVVIQNRNDLKYYRLNFSLTEAEGFAPSDMLVEVTKTYVPAEVAQFNSSEVEAFEAEYAKKNKPEEDKEDKEDKKNSDNTSEGDDKDEEKKCPECGKPVDECTCEDEKKKEDEEEKKKKYSLDEIPEYGELQTKYSELENKYNDLIAEKEALEAQLAPLTAFKAAAEKKEKEALIGSFYMLSDEDKSDVVTNIDTYSLDEIEAKLSIICVRNKVNFNLEDDKDTQHNEVTTYNLENDDDASVPAWVKRALSVAKTLN